jgi:hypothetical protein
MGGGSGGTSFMGGGRGWSRPSVAMAEIGSMKRITEARESGFTASPTG